MPDVSLLHDKYFPKLEAFSKEAEGVKAAQDIEYLHRMRVASRRLRAALPLLAHCYPEKKYQKWTREIKKTAGMLGEAREFNVQIEFLKQYRKRIARKRNAFKSPPTQPDGPQEQAIHFLLTGVRDRRTNLQKDVLSGFRNFEKQNIIEEIKSALIQKFMGPRRKGTLPPCEVFRPMAAGSSGKEIAELLSYEPWVKFPDAVAEHHAMRIAAKNLRLYLGIICTL